MEDANIVNAIFLTGLTILYFFTMLYLFKNLNTLVAGCLKAEQKTIIHQFFVFMAAYTTRAAFKFSINYLESEGNLFHVTHLVEACLVLLWNPIPITYVLLCVHLKSFRHSMKMMHESVPKQITH